MYHTKFKEGFYELLYALLFSGQNTNFVLKTTIKNLERNVHLIEKKIAAHNLLSKIFSNIHFFSEDTTIDQKLITKAKRLISKRSHSNN